MNNIQVHRYPVPTEEQRAQWPQGVTDVSDHWQGWIEPDDLSWIAFIEKDGKPVVYLDRDPVTGAVR